MGDVIRLALTENPLHVWLSTLDSDLSRKTMFRCVLTMQEMLGKTLHSATSAELTFLRKMLTDRYEPATTAKHLSALRGYLRVANRLGMVADPAVMRDLPDLKNPKGTRLLRGRALDEAEIQAMLARCDQTTPIGARDGAMLAILRAGLRRQEVVDLDLEHADLAGQGTLKVRGKRDKERLVPLADGARLLILKWLVHRGTEPGPLLSNTQTLPALERLSTTTVDDRVKAVWVGACLANGKPKPSPHDMRRTLATDLFDRGADPHAIQELLGHANLETTCIYDRGVEKRKRTAMDLIPALGAKGNADA